jgi:tRNA pseudouridine38-40 synthase
MSQRLKLIVAYDGTHYAGWQSQSHRNTIQDRLEHAFKKITGDNLRVHGAGRTDAGVHAIAQVAHVDVPACKLTPARWLAALNALLPPSIRVLRCQNVSENFHARFSAKGKVYRYRIWSAPVLPPSEFQRAWHVISEVDLAVLKSAALIFIGTHDFAGFAANRGHQETDTTRTVHSINVRQRGSCLTIDLDADGFLYKMARLIVGALVQCATGQQTMSKIAERFGRNPSPKGRLVAPASGLFLLRVRY